MFKKDSVLQDRPLAASEPILHYDRKLCVEYAASRRRNYAGWEKLKRHHSSPRNGTRRTTCSAMHRGRRKGRKPHMRGIDLGM